MKGFRREGAGEPPRARGKARSWAKLLLSQLMDKYPDANEFRVRLIPEANKTISVEVTVDDPVRDA
jgi:hypothetical protein